MARAIAYAPRLRVDRFRHEEAVVSALDQARRAVRIAGFGAITGVMLPAYAAHDALARAAERDAIRDRWIHAWASALLRLFGVHVDAVGDLDGGHGRLVVSNHRSTIDIAALLHTFGGHVVSRADVARWPLIGAAARKVGTVFVDRGDARSGASTVRAMRTLLERGRTVIVFPEGTTFEDDVVRPFHAGSFLAALRTSARVVPVGIAYARGSGAAFVGETFPRHLARLAAAKPSRVVLRVGDAIEVGDAPRAAALADRARSAVQSLVNEARAIVDT
jgi:1-acyl-sn-glycerol-3-phosphate acyltransferase